jgi:phage shock protein C
MSYKKFVRSKTDRKIFGVCGGIAEYFNIDPVLIRILFVFLFFFGMLGFFLYIALAIIIPKEPLNPEIHDGTETQEPNEPHNTKKDFEEMGKNFGASMEDAGKNFGAKMEELGKDFEKNMKNFGKEMENHAENFTKHSPTGKFFLSIIGTLFIGLGATILIAKFFPFFRFGFYFPAILIFCGILLIIFSFNNKPKA